LLNKVVANVEVNGCKSEGWWGRGIFAWRWPDPATTFRYNTPQGSLQVHNLHVNGTGASLGAGRVGPTGMTYTNNVFQFTGGERAPSVYLENAQVYGITHLILDNVAMRVVDPGPGLTQGLGQQMARVPIYYEGYSNGVDVADLRYNSRLVTGNKAIATFSPTSAGWYRVLSQGIAQSQRHLAAELTINTLARESSKVEVEVSPTASGYEQFFNVVRPTATNSSTQFIPAVDRIRAYAYVTNNFWACYADIHVQAIAANRGEILVTQTINDGWGETDLGLLELVGAPYLVPDALPNPGGTLSSNSVSVLRDANNTVTFLESPTNAPTDGYKIQRTGNHNKWVP
jgi:hypothetical protein